MSLLLQARMAAQLHALRAKKFGMAMLLQRLRAD